MGKRQKRIFPNQIAQSLAEIINKEVNIVLKSGKTIASIVKTMNNNQMVVQDHFLQKHNVRLEEIEEIVIDFVAPY